MRFDLLLDKVTTPDDSSWGWNYIDCELKTDSIFALVENGSKDTRLPISEADHTNYDYRLKRILLRFLWGIGFTYKDGGGKTPQDCKRFKMRMEKLCQSVYDAYHLSSLGKNTEAVDLLYNTFFSEIKTSFIGYLSPSDTLYRMRESAGYQLFNSKEQMFHIPFELKHKTQCVRYCIPCLPSLYLSSSVYNCWKEMNMPDLETANVAMFQANRKIPYVDLSFPEKKEPFKEEELDMLPLIIALDMPVVNRYSPTKLEYRLSQLVMECVIRLRDSNDCFRGRPLGIKYKSVRRKYDDIDFSPSSYSDLYDDYVFAPVEVHPKGHCPILLDAFDYKNTTSLFQLITIHPVNRYLFDHHKHDDYFYSSFYKIEQFFTVDVPLTYDSLSGALSTPK